MPRPVTTPSGYRRLCERLDAARASYLEVTASNEEAAGAGDSSVWHDNFAYEENQRQMHQLARRVRDLEQTIALIDIVHPPREPARVCVGCLVEVADLDTDRILRYHIAGFEDGDTTHNRIAYNAPLGTALIGAEPGEVRIVTLGGKARELEILRLATSEET